MRRRSIVLLAGGLLLAVSPPVFGIGDEPAPDPSQSATTSTTMGTDPDPSSTTTTAPDGAGMTPGPGDGTSPDPGDDTSTDPGDDTSTDPGDDTSTDPGDDSTTDPGDDSTTDPGDDSSTDPGGSSNACETPERIHEPAPAEGESVIYDAGEAGQVEVRRASATELEIVQVTPNDGWQAEVREEIGPRVKARFTDQAGTKVRFAASMDDAGEEIHIRVSTCG